MWTIPALYPVVPKSRGLRVIIAHLTSAWRELAKIVALMAAITVKNILALLKAATSKS